MFDTLPKHSYGAILADPPWRFRTWDKSNVVGKVKGSARPGHGVAAYHYRTMSIEGIRALPVGELCLDDAALFLWISWPNLLDALSVVEAWGFTFKTCAFCWIKAHAGQIELFRDDLADQMGLGYWTRANSEVCLLATRGDPKRKARDVRQAIIEPRREHSRKPACVRGRIERLVDGPYLELFARTPSSSWSVWGNETDKFAEAAE